jgi:hypothetical protein
MKKTILVLSVALAFCSCATMTRWMVGWAVQPYIGMSETAMLENGPFVYHVNSTTTAHGVQKQYIFTSGNANPKYVYIENGVVVGWQN